MLRIAALAIIFLNAGLLLVAAGSALWGFENPREPLNLQDIPVNAHRTGSGLLLEQRWVRDGERVHRGFNQSSNACASCHQTHTASGVSLVFQNTAYNTCMTCHDGTYPVAYNVLAGTTLYQFKEGEKHMAYGAAGILYDSRVEPHLSGSIRQSVSFHLSTGAKQHKDAPGADEALPGNWEQPFTCISCHGPHGTYSGRHLHFNPNGRVERQGRQTVQMKHMGAGVYSIDALDPDAHRPWLYADPEREPDLALLINGNVPVEDEVSINYAVGAISFLNGYTGPVSVSYYRPLVVAIDVFNHTNPDVPETVVHGSGVVDFCISCHTGFVDDKGNTTHRPFANSARRVGEEVVEFHHPIGVHVPAANIPAGTYAALALEVDGPENRLTCLTCHYGHGTDITRLMRRQADWDVSGELEFLAKTLDLTNPALIPKNTASLRYFNPENNDSFGGRFEACYLCHGGFYYTPSVGRTDPNDNADVLAAEQPFVDVFLAEAGVTLVEETINDATFIVTEGVEPVRGTITYTAVEGRIRFTPENPWQDGMSYTVELTAGIKSRSGGSMVPYSFSFHILPGVRRLENANDSVAAESANPPPEEPNAAGPDPPPSEPDLSGPAPIYD